jgi:hypothetical protein
MTHHFRQVKRMAVVPLATFLLLSNCSKAARDDAKAVGQNAQAGCIAATLPPKVLNRLADGAIQITGHWVLKVSEAPAGLPFGAQPLNSAIIRCSPLKRICAEYRAQITSGILLPLDPVEYQIMSWDLGRIVAKMDAGPDVRLLLNIDGGSEQAEMEFRRQASPDRARVFERFVLE